ncbi:MAG: chemotaxis protein [Zetaproteobacteria bacterium CG_4_9_14_3_um_filter_53_7]|nr:MAG: chemotaxis protein [Zetaproteobacteria bacterium CG_4_9_14_3_um_filter_53_7]
MLHVVIGGRDVLLRPSQIKEIVRPVALTTVPMGPDHLLGLANIHGQIVCIIDVGKVSTMPSPSAHENSRTRLLILRHPVMHVGIRVDEVKRIQKVDASKVTQSMATASAGSIVQLELEGHHYELLDCSRLLHKSSY